MRLCCESIQWQYMQMKFREIIWKTNIGVIEMMLLFSTLNYTGLTFKLEVSYSRPRVSFTVH